MMYNCNWDTLTTVITLSASVLLVISLVVCLYKLKIYISKSKLVSALYIIASLVIMSSFAVALYMPLRIVTTEDAIRIEQVKGYMKIPYSEISEIRKITNSDDANSYRTFGSGGFWGFLGYFKNDQLGSYEKYVTDRSCQVLIKTSSSVYVISCENPDELIENVMKD